MNRFLVVIEKAKGNYFAYSPDFSGCAAAGAVCEEASLLLSFENFFLAAELFRKISLTACTAPAVIEAGRTRMPASTAAPVQLLIVLNTEFAFWIVDILFLKASRHPAAATPMATPMPGVPSPARIRGVEEQPMRSRTPICI